MSKGRWCEDLVIERLAVDGYEKVYQVTNEKSGLKAIIAIHNTDLGPALGGIRIYPYGSFDEALDDVLRLSQGMTYKASVAQVGFGGGKSVIIADPKKDKTDELLESFGAAVDSLGGEYICAEDVGCTADDVMKIRRTTKYVTGLPHKKSSGDPGKYTAWGIFRGMESVLERLYASRSFRGKKIAIQGLGSVGSHLLDHLFWHGAELVVTDINEDVLKKVQEKYHIKTVSPEEIFSVECDIFSPCAMGGIINDGTIAKLNCKAIAGCANNQLLSEHHGDVLHERGILIAPDFVINAGGLINVSFETEKDGYHPGRSRKKIDKIYDVLMSIYDISEKENISSSRAAISLADDNIAKKIGKRSEKPVFHH